MIDDRIAPFTPEEVLALTEYQRTRCFHPYTCGNRGDGKHPELDGDTGILIPTINGWICQFCDYKQNWAMTAMTDGSMVQKRIAQLGRLADKKNKKAT